MDLVAGSNGASGGEIVEQTYNLSWVRACVFNSDLVCVILHSFL